MVYENLMSTCHHCSFRWLRQPWQSSQQPAVQQRYPDELFAPLLKAFCWNSKSLVGLDDFPNISLVTLVCSWIFSLIGSVSQGAFPKETSLTPSGWRIPSLWEALSRLLTGPGSQKELLRSLNFIEPSVVWNHTGVAI